MVGDAGVGKARLVTEAVAASRERLMLAGGCLPMRHALPLLPIVDGLDTAEAAARRDLTRAVRSLPPSLRPHVACVMPRTLPEEIQPAGEVRREKLFLACEALLPRVAEERPVTLVVDDIHWATPTPWTCSRTSREPGTALASTCLSPAAPTKPGCRSR